MLGMLATWWPALFALATMGLMCFIDPSPPTAAMWPPTLELTGAQAKRVWTSPWFLGVVLPMAAGLAWLRSFVARHGLPAEEAGSMVWWLVNLFWFHTGCDILSGLFQTMPILTELYIHMNGAHRHPRWHDERAALDAGYALELFVEVPLAAYVLYLFACRDQGRYVAEVFACAVQAAGTVTYYAPALAKGEFSCWLTYADRSCGFVWILFPAILLRRHLAKARWMPGGNKAKNGAKTQ